MKTLDEIKKLMSDGETAEADGALKELLVSEPENLEAKMLYGTCRQLLGDEETFKRIHDEIAPKMENKDGTELQLETVSLWRKYHELWMTLIAGALILAGIGTVGWYFLRVDVSDMFGLALYRGPVAVEMEKRPAKHEENINNINLYAAPSYFKRQYEEEALKEEEQQKALEEDVDKIK